MAGLDDVEKRKFLTLPGLELRLLGCPARSQALYRLRYPGSLLLFSWLHVTKKYFKMFKFPNFINDMDIPDVWGI
jgi:hypothetical protein